MAEENKNILLDVSFDDGKYRIIQEHNRGLRVLRGGEEWRDITGDNMVLVLASELEETREARDRLKQALGIANRMLGENGLMGVSP